MLWTWSASITEGRHHRHRAIIMQRRSSNLPLQLKKLVWPSGSSCDGFFLYFGLPKVSVVSATVSVFALLSRAMFAWYTFVNGFTNLHILFFLLFCRCWDSFFRLFQGGWAVVIISFWYVWWVFFALSLVLCFHCLLLLGERIEQLCFLLLFFDSPFLYNVAG